MDYMEGNTSQAKSQGRRPGVLVCLAPPGSEIDARAQGSSRNLRDLVTSGVKPER